MGTRSLVLCFLIAFAPRAEAMSFLLDPGPEGTSYFYKSVFFTGVLEGTSMQGQTESVDFLFSDDKFLAAGALDIDIWINQDSPMDFWPTESALVTGYLLDADGNAVTSTTDFAHTGTMPTQIWPGWGYYLPDGTEYLPAATGYSGNFVGARIDLAGTRDYLLDAMVFSGIHFDITYPDNDVGALGFQLSLSNFRHRFEDQWINPIYVSPRSEPTFRVPVPEPATGGLMLIGTGLLTALRRIRRAAQDPASRL